VSRSPVERIDDIVAAIDRCTSYRPHLGSGDVNLATMAYDAVLRNLAVIGEAVRTLPDEVKDTHPSVPWPAIAGLRNVVIHEYFRVDPAIVQDVLDGELARLRAALRPGT
jgi:uncharacterized protein with HEPN domain